ncbi:MAG: TlpA disulfide reductase family protein [Longimicrobiales bacterium]
MTSRRDPSDGSAACAARRSGPRRSGPRRSGPRRSGATLAAVLALAGAATGVEASVLPDTVPGAGLEVHGQADYEWRLEDLDGAPLSLADYRGEVVVVNMWATWCAPCVRELASFQRLRASLGDAPVRFLFVSPEERGHVQTFVRRYGWDLPFAVEAEEMPDAFGLEALPTTYVIDRAGRTVLKHRGAAEWDRDPVRRFLDHLAAPGRSSAR